jgi:hypothetical protein
MARQSSLSSRRPLRVSAFLPLSLSLSFRCARLRPSLTQRVFEQQRCRCLLENASSISLAYLVVNHHDDDDDIAAV